MNPAAAIASEAAARIILNAFIARQEQWAREANYVPSPADVERFLTERVEADTPAAIEAEARQELKG